MAERIELTEVGPRDGLQNEPTAISSADKIALIDALADAGLKAIEATAFVRPDRIPQLADAEAVMAGISRRRDVCYSVLVPNERGLDRALPSMPDAVAVFTAASETFSQRNTNASIEQTLERFAPVFDRCREERLPLRAYVSTAVACPYEGPVDPAAVAQVVARLLELGPCEIDLGDTIGAAAPNDIEALLEAVSRLVTVDELVLHLHDTGGRAIDCARRAIELGVRRFDAACGGLGGCPYAPGAPGNVSTGDLVELCDALGFETGVDGDAVRALGGKVRQLVDQG
ncbi:MAG: hydroxymethylglutaryl-CoA lyase [Phycisphaerales bacterium]|nr:hydroxymethylglutaryl-CoA lyase [Phycisphaerales bacterium]